MNMKSEINVAVEVDARGLACPLPILRAKKALSTLDSDQLLRVLATDPGSVRDFQAFSRQTGNELVEQKQVGTVWSHVLRRR
jgi:tRNA 2-thiouridine synthesizing protein A